MAKEPVWILPEVVPAIHKMQLAEHGGSPGLRDEGLLLSALERPRQTWFYKKPKPDISILASHYAFGIIRNHPFVDGNKRVALVVCQLFLQLNGFVLKASGAEKYLQFYGLAAGTITEADFVVWLRQNIKKRCKN